MGRRGIFLIIGIPNRTDNFEGEPACPLLWFTSTATLPQAADVVVIGGGIIGSFRLAHERATRALPGLRTVPIATAWADYIDSTPDGVPAIGPVPQVPGLTLAAGFSGHGFALGPGAGHLTAQIVTGERPNFDMSGFDLARFAQSTSKVADF